MPFKEGPRRAGKDAAGNLVYACTWEGCDKTFGTAQHARRHEKSHVGSTPYICPHCEKSFVRSDVRAKHVQTMHGIGGSGATKRERDSSASSDTPPMKQKYFMTDRLDHRRSPTMSQTSPQDFRQRSGSLTLPSWIDSQHQAPTLSTSGGGGATLFTAGPNGTPLLGGPAGMMLPPPTPFSGPHSSSSGFLDPAALSTSALPLDPVLGSTTDMFDPFNTNWDAFGQAFGWGFENDLDLGIGLQNSMFDNSDIGPVSSTDTLSAAWLMSMTPRNGSPVGDGKGVPTMESDQRTDPFGRKHDNPWPSIFKPKVPDRPLTLGGVKASPRPHRDPSAPEAINKTARNAMLSLIYLSHQNLWLMPDIGDFPDNETLSDFVDLYFENFHPTFPILHRPTFLTGETPAVLLLSVAAVGATYAEKSVQPLAVALSELVRRIVTWMRASDQRSKFDRHALMAYTLQAALDIACGSREMFLHAEIMRSSITTTCRRLNLLRATKLATDELMAKDPKASAEERWKAYIEDEGRRRLGWGIFLLDAQMAALLGHPCMMSINEVTVPLPGADEAWNAATAQDWVEAVPALETNVATTFPATLSSLLKGTDVQLPDYANSIVSHTFYRFLMDAYQLSHALDPEDADGEQTLTAYLPSRLESKPRRLLLQLARTSFPVASPTHLRLSSAALFHHSYIAFARPGLMEHIKAASGRSTPEMNKRHSIDWLETWAENGKEVRMVLWHAGVLNALLADFPQGALSELFWTFDCALVFWAIVKYAGHRLRSSELKSALFAANWFDTEPPKVWVDHGGQLVLPYLGSSATLDVNNTLTFFMDRLDTIPWGWARLFRQVLGKLLTTANDAGSDEAE